MRRFTDLYPVWILLTAVVAMLKPESMIWITGGWTVGALSLVMLCMGFTLTFDDFRRLFRMPGVIAVGLLAHYTIMPLSGWGVAVALKLEPSFALGLILVASCPSGMASNVISYLARANVALAVMITLASTMTAFIMTPILCKTLAGHYVPVNALELCLKTLQMAVLPVLTGVFCNLLFPKAVAKASRFGPFVSVLALMMVTGGIVATNAQAVMANMGILILATFLLHTLGFGVGYLSAKIIGYPEDMSRTISIEVGMQNGGLAAVLARQAFPLQPLAAVPAVFSSLVQTIVGSLVATWWRMRHEKKSEEVPAEVELP